MYLPLPLPLNVADFHLLNNRVWMTFFDNKSQSPISGSLNVFTHHACMVTAVRLAGLVLISK
jgi:hypothetical protein